MYEGMTPDDVYDVAHERKDRYFLAYHIAQFVLDAKYTRIVLGQENIIDGGAVYIGNHVHKDDSMLLSLAVTEKTEKPLRMLAKSDYFEAHTIKEKFDREIMLMTGAIPVERRNPTRDTIGKMNTRSLGALAADESIGAHGEGTRLDRLHAFHSGPARIAMEAGVPLVPFACSYPEERGTLRPFGVIQFGEPIMPEEYNSDAWRIYLGKANKANHASKVLNDRVAGLLGIPHHRRVFDFAPIPPRRSK